jgi:hypothetical protein
MIMSFFFEPAAGAASAFGSAFIFGFAFKLPLVPDVGLRDYVIIEKKCVPASFEKRGEGGSAWGLWTHGNQNEKRPRTAAVMNID